MLPAQPFAQLRSTPVGVLLLELDDGLLDLKGELAGMPVGPSGAILFFFKQKTAYEIGLGIPAEPLFRSKNVITSCSVTMMLFLHLEVKPLMTLTTVLYLSCALISGHLAMMLMELTKRR